MKRYAYWITEATDTHSDYVNAFLVSTPTVVKRMRLSDTL